VHELTFTLVTVVLWGQAAIDQIAMEFSRRYDGSLAVHSFPWRMPGRCPRPADPWIPQESRPLVVGGRVSGHWWKGVPSGPPSLVPPRALQGRSVPPSLRSVRYSHPFGTPCGRPFRARGPRNCPRRGLSGPPDPEQGRHPACAKADAPLPAKEASTAHRSDAHDR